MKSPYQILNAKLEKEIQNLQKEVKNQQLLSEYASGGGMGIAGGGFDPDYSGTQPAWQQNKGYVTGLQGANSDMIVANPIIIDKTAKSLVGKQAGTFNFDQTPQKPLTANNIGLGMGFGLGDQEFAVTRDFINQHSKNYKLDPSQQYDPNELGYLSWRAVNDAVAARETAKLQNTLAQWGMYIQSPDGSYQSGIGSEYSDEYGIKDPSVAFAKKLKKAQENGNAPKEKKSKISKTQKTIKNNGTQKSTTKFKGQSVNKIVKGKKNK